MFAVRITFAIPDRRLLQQPQAKDVVHVEHSIVLTLKITSGGCRSSDKGRRVGDGHPNPEKRVEGRLKKTFFRPFGPQFGLKMRGGGGGVPRAPPLDPPLITVGECSVLLCGRRKKLQSIVEAS